MKRLLLLPLVFLSIISIVYSQNCEVAVDALKGDYSGGCVKGKADGMGTASGTDSYTGHFKKGFPEGEGKYLWKNGDSYSGTWKHGVFEGQGTLTKYNHGGADSTIILTGFWKKGTYLGKYEKPYAVQSLSNNISNVSVRKTSGSAKDLVVTIKSITGGAASLNSNSPLLAKPQMVDVQIITGRFERQLKDETSSAVQNKYTFYQVSYPFYAIFTFRTDSGGPEKAAERVGVEIRENAAWAIHVDVDN